MWLVLGKGSRGWAFGGAYMGGREGGIGCVGWSKEIVQHVRICSACMNMLSMYEYVQHVRSREMGGVVSRF